MKIGFAFPIPFQPQRSRRKRREIPVNSNSTSCCARPWLSPRLPRLRGENLFCFPDSPSTTKVTQETKRESDKLQLNPCCARPWLSPRLRASVVRICFAFPSRAILAISPIRKPARRNNRRASNCHRERPAAAGSRTIWTGEAHFCDPLPASLSQTPPPHSTLVENKSSTSIRQDCRQDCRSPFLRFFGSPIWPNFSLTFPFPLFGQQSVTDLARHQIPITKYQLPSTKYQVPAFLPLLVASG